MIKKSYKIISIAIVVLLLHAGSGFTQQSNTLYFMHKIPQANRMNPANQSYCKFFLGLPVISSLYFNYGNNGFAIGDLVYPENGMLKIDANNFFNTLRDVNNIAFDTEFNVFSLGIGIKETYFTISNSIKLDFGFSFPKGVFALAFEGNGKHIGADDPLDISGFGLNFNAYGETAIGLSRTFSDKLTVGIRGKLYSGLLNVTTAKTDLLWYTYKDPAYKWDFVADLDFRLTAPIDINLVDTVDVNTDITQSELIDYLATYENFGLGLDLGASYELTRQLTLSASVIDLGSIKWKNGANTFNSSANFSYEGVDIGLLMGDADSLTGMLDTIVESFKFSQNNDPYRTGPPTQLFLGASYFLNSNWGLGVLYRSKFYNNLSFNSLTLSANTGIGNFMTLTGSYSIAYNSFNNFGLGLSVKLLMMQFYLINDNIMAFVYPQNARNVNMRFGFNIILGCRAEKKKAAAKKEKDMLQQQNDIDPGIFY